MATGPVRFELRRSVRKKQQSTPEREKSPGWDQSRVLPRSGKGRLNAAILSPRFLHSAGGGVVGRRNDFPLDLDGLGFQGSQEERRALTSRGGPGPLSPRSKKRGARLFGPQAVKLESMVVVAPRRKQSIEREEGEGEAQRGRRRSMDSDATVKPRPIDVNEMDWHTVFRRAKRDEVAQKVKSSGLTFRRPGEIRSVVDASLGLDCHHCWSVLWRLLFDLFKETDMSDDNFNLMFYLLFEARESEVPPPPRGASPNDVLNAYLNRSIPFSCVLGTAALNGGPFMATMYQLLGEIMLPGDYLKTKNKCTQVAKAAATEVVAKNVIDTKKDRDQFTQAMIEFSKGQMASVDKILGARDHAGYRDYKEVIPLLGLAVTSRRHRNFLEILGEVMVHNTATDVMKWLNWHKKPSNSLHWDGVMRHLVVLQVRAPAEVWYSCIKVLWFALGTAAAFKRFLHAVPWQDPEGRSFLTMIARLPDHHPLMVVLSFVEADFLVGRKGIRPVVGVDSDYNPYLMSQPVFHRLQNDYRWRNEEAEAIKAELSELVVSRLLPENPGKSLLHEIAQYGSVDVMNVLLGLSEELGISVDHRDNKGRTPLHYAITRDGVDMVKMLVDKGGANVNAKDVDGESILHSGARADRGSNCLHLRKTYHAVPNVNIKKQSPYNAALEAGATETAKILSTFIKPEEIKTLLDNKSPESP